MRLLMALALSVAVALAAATPHVHLQAAVPGGEECAVCLARSGQVASRQAPDLEPVETLVEELVAPPALRAVAGAPLGAVPGQSPPPA